MIEIFLAQSSVDFSNLVQTIAILAGLIIFLLKIILDEWNKRKNGKSLREFTCNYMSEREKLIELLSNKELKDDIKSIREELRNNREEMIKMRLSMDALLLKISSMVKLKS